MGSAVWDWWYILLQYGHRLPQRTQGPQAQWRVLASAPPEVALRVSCAYRVPEECPEEVETVINNCRRLDPNERPTALEVCSVIENSAPRRSESGGSGMHEGELRCLCPLRC